MLAQEGFPTYSGLEDSAIERLAVGLYDGMSQDWLAYRITPGAVSGGWLRDH